MKERLKREFNKTYLVLTSEGETYEESYELEMILRNSPEGILPLRVLRVDGEVQLYYEVSSKQSLKDCSEREKLSGDLLRSLFEAIGKLMKETEDYLLDAENILFDLEHIYIKESEIFFCYCPWHHTEALTAFRELLEGVLGVIDYHDTDGVALAYHLYQAACKGDFQIEEVLGEHGRKEEKTDEPQPFSGIDPSEEEELTENPVWEPEPLTEKESPVKNRLFNKIIKFFLKKEKLEEYEEAERNKKKTVYEIPKPQFACEINEDCEYTKVLELVCDSTVLLEEMPHGTWRLRPLAAGYEEFCMTADSFVVGKKRGAVDGLISRDSVSRIHSRFYVRDGRLFVSDANSTNGTFVNGDLIAPGEMTEIFAGDRIMFADVGYECYNSL